MCYCLEMKVISLINCYFQMNNSAKRNQKMYEYYDREDFFFFFLFPFFLRLVYIIDKNNSCIRRHKTVWNSKWILIAIIVFLLIEVKHREQEHFQLNICAVIIVDSNSQDWFSTSNIFSASLISLFSGSLVM